VFTNSGVQDFPNVLLKSVIDKHVVDVENADEVLGWLERARIQPEMLQWAPVPFEHLSTMSKPHLKNFWGLYDQYKESKRPNSPFRYAVTWRYGEGPELCVEAVRDIDALEVILAGKFATLSEKDAQNLEAEAKGFSLIRTRPKNINIFQGPAQFLNHDCDWNAKFRLNNSGTIKVVATRLIKADEEILVYYDKHCFGQDNQDCLCRTCQRNWRRTGICPDSEDSGDSGNE
jgi:histone-lysine N-methyltransferase SUV420H